MPNTQEETETLAAANKILAQSDLTIEEQIYVEETFDGILADWHDDKQESDNG